MQLNWPEYQARPADAPKPLQGIRVVDFTHFAAGPFATQILADMGADVIKVEPAGRGDDFRYYPPFHPDEQRWGAPFFWTNRNKRSIALNLKTEAGLGIAKRLTDHADVVVENFSTGVMARFGLDYEQLKDSNPKLIYCSVSAYGRDGEFADRLGFDPIAQAESGFIHITGYPDREGTRTRASVMDIGTALITSNAILGALMARHQTGKGQAVDVSLFESGIIMTGFTAMQYLFSGEELMRSGNRTPDTVPSGVFRASDKPFYINCPNDSIFQRLTVHVIERPDMANNPRMATPSARRENQEEIFEVLQELFETKPWSYWKPRMRAAGMPYGEIRTIGEALNSPEARDLEIVTRIPHPEHGWLPNVGFPVHYSDTPLVDPRPAPTIGEHTAEILEDVLGLDAQAIKDLERNRAFEESSRG